MEINIIELLHLLLRRLWIIVLVGLVGAGLAFSYSNFYLTPLFTSNTTLYVNNTAEARMTDRFAHTDIIAAQELVSTYVEIIGSNSVISLVYEDINGQYSRGELSGMLSVAAVRGTVVINISVTTANRYNAQTIANSFVRNATTRIEEVIRYSGVEIIDEANLPGGHSFPNHQNFIMIGLLAGVVLAIVCIVISDIFDTRIKDEQDFITAFPDIPIIGIIPKLDEV